VIVPLTEVGEVTARVLGLNDPDRLLERESLAAVNRYLTDAARSRMGQ
jgi:hypothetical protein